MNGTVRGHKRDIRVDSGKGRNRPPEGNVRLFRSAKEAVLGACGYPVQLDQDSDGTAQREAWRRYLHGTVAPFSIRLRV